MEKTDIWAQIIDAVKMLLLFAISMFGLVKAAESYNKERSLGKSAIDKMKTDNEQVRKELNDIKSEFDRYIKNHSEIKEDLDIIKRKYDRLIEKILNNFPFK